MGRMTDKELECHFLVYYLSRNMSLGEVGCALKKIQNSKMTHRRIFRYAEENHRYLRYLEEGRQKGQWEPAFYMPPTSTQSETQPQTINQGE